MPQARTRTPFTSDRLKQYRGTRQPLPPGDKRVLAVLIPHLCFLPWALGTMHPWSQITSLALAVIGFAVALTAPAAFNPPLSEPQRRLGDSSRDHSREQQEGVTLPTSDIRPPSSVRRLLKFPPFWLGLALLGYLLLQVFNPSWRYVTNGTSWWLVRVPNLSWLPTSVDVPFDRFNLWRQFIIYASAWLTLCTVVIGLTRRRSFGILLAALSINGLFLALVGFFARLTRTPETVLWFKQWHHGVITFSSFIYKNHAGAYLALMATVLLVVAARYRERSLREHARSSPALLPVLGALTMFFAVAFTYSRGATLLLVAYLLAAAAAFAAHRYITRSESSTPRVVTFTVAAMVAFVVVFALAQVNFGRVVDRFEKLAATERQDESITGRRDAGVAGRDMLANTWPRGVGAGGFRHLFPGYIRRFAGSYRGGQLFWEHAHNDWLEIPIEQGVVGSGILMAGAFWWLWRLGRSGVWRRLPSILLTLGLLQTLVHAAIDFPFQNPAILITWLVLAMVAVRYGAPDATDQARL